MTFDTDYLTLHSSGVPHAGIGWCNEDKYSIGGLIDTLVVLHTLCTAEDMHNRLEYL